MSKVRIYELAKETGLPNKEVVRRLTELGVDARSHSSSVDEDAARQFRESLGRQREERRKREEERTRREAEEYDISSLRTATPAEAKARRILPPHLRAAQSGAGSAAAGDAGAGTGAPARRFRPPAGQPFRPDATQGGVSVGGETQASAPAVDRPAEDVPAAPDDERPDAAVSEPPAQAPVAEPSAPVAEPAAPVAEPAAPVVEPPAAATSQPEAPVTPATERVAEPGPEPEPAQPAVQQPPAAQAPVPPPSPDRRPSAAEAARAGVVRAAGAEPAAPPQAQQPQTLQPQRRQEPRPPQRQVDPRQPARPAARGDRPAPGAGDGGVPGVPGVPRPNTPPRPGQPTLRPRPTPTSSAATGVPVQPTRRVEHNLPREGSGKRNIPPPLRPAPATADASAPTTPTTPARGRPAGGRPAGAPARPGGPAARRPGAGAPASPGAPGGAPSAPGGAPGGRGRPVRGKKGKRRRDPTPQDEFEAQAQARGPRRAGPVRATVTGPVDVVPGVTVGEFAKLIGVSPTDIVRTMFTKGQMLTVTQSMTEDQILEVALELAAEVNFVTPEDLEFGIEPDEDAATLEPRAPVVTVMGHVDHGKTLLLDSIRHADVVSGEAGGITQHIGAYQVRQDGRAITFIDTPGHEAFTQMRARGAKVTDVAILVVAADDGVKPQTVEAINHIKAAEVPIIVAVNKVDKENADPTRVRTQLTEYELIAEEFGGQTTMVDVSAKTGTNLDELLEMVLLQADVEDLKANPDRRARGAVIEGNLDRGRGAVATVLVQAGTLRVGDNLVAGQADCKVRAMFDDEGRAVRQAGPSTPVLVLGWNFVPDAGDEFRVVDDERTAREIAANRQARQRRMELASRRTLSLEELSGAIAQGQLQTLNLIVKGDVAGSVEAVADAVSKLELPEVKVRLVHKGVGAVTENDVSLAEASNAIIIGFNVRPEANARAAIEETGVDLRQYSIIYQAVEDIERAVRGLLAPEYEEVVTGRAQVREVFRVPRVGFVFGCYVTEGALRRNGTVRVVRDGVVVADDQIGSLRRFRDDVTEVTTNFECGVGLERFADVKEGDEFEVYEQREIARA